MGLQLIDKRFLLIYAAVDTVRITNGILFQMGYTLYAKNMGRYLVRGLQSAGLQKKLQKLTIIVLPAHAPILHLQNQRRVAYNICNDVVGDNQDFMTFTFMLCRVQKPAFQRIPFAPYIFPNSLFHVSLSFRQRMGNLHLTLNDSFQQPFFNLCTLLSQQLRNTSGMSLQLLNKFIQILDKPILM